MPFKLHEFQIRSLDEFRLVDFIHAISTRINAYESIYYENTNPSNLVNCAPNLPYFKAYNNVLDFTMNSIQQKNDAS